eukprot:scaffold4659_cov352-Prasinococcus_capsulatus_cf.AAC.1
MESGWEYTPFISLKTTPLKIISSSGLSSSRGKNTASRIACAVWIREGIQERVQGALDQLHKGLLHRVLARAAEYGVLEDVRQARGVLRRRAQHDAEHLVFVVVGERHHLRARLGVLEHRRVGAILLHVLVSHKLEAVQVFWHHHAVSDRAGHALQRPRTHIQRPNARGPPRQLTTYLCGHPPCRTVSGAPRAGSAALAQQHPRTGRVGLRELAQRPAQGRSERGGGQQRLAGGQGAGGLRRAERELGLADRGVEQGPREHTPLADDGARAAAEAATERKLDSGGRIQMRAGERHQQ